MYVAGNLTIQGDTTTLNTATLVVEDKLAKLANVTTPTTTTADGAGIQVEASATEAEWPELKWSNSGNLTGWSLSDYKSTSNEDFPVSVMKFGTSALVVHLIQAMEHFLQILAVMHYTFTFNV